MAVTLLLGAACSSPTGIPGTALTVLAQGESLRLANHSDRRTFYFIYEREAAAVINWAQCVDPSRCPSLLPGGQTAVPYSAIGGYERGKSEAIVWSWEAVPGPARQPVPGPVQAVVIRL
jgi:hypothetical protein